MARPPRGSFRIIGGEWRSRRFEFVAGSELRPSPDRVRETLFNWLMPLIEGARCLDLYAGSGALGLEALSRGAAQVSFVDRDPQALAQIRAHLAVLKAQDRAELLQTDAQQYLARAGGAATARYDIVFLDPPFGRGLLLPVLAALPPWLRPGHRVYLESEFPPPQLPPDWQRLKQGRAGRVAYSLVSFQPSPHNPADAAA